ncbi:MAG TPA: lysophospholipid acyltransferase family protein [Coleofasciculaceae cyanobacterium]|jgi:1-acyl-sn-glycerol-3-phosphate acyltransferase
MNTVLPDSKSTSRKSEKARYNTLTDSQLEWPHWVYQWICIKLLEIYLRLRYDVRIYGKENQPKGFQSYIVACNHTSTKDPPLVSIALDYQPIAYMAKLELFRTPILRLYNWAMSTFAVNREKLELSTVKTALKVLKHGKWALGIFPEGSRQKDGQLGEAKRGVAYFAKTAWAPVLPLAVVHSTPPKGKKRLEVRIGKLIPPEKDMDALTLKIQNAIAELAEQTKTGA